MLENIKNYLNFNKGERNGILVVIAFIILAAVFPYLKKYPAADHNEDFKRFADDIMQFEASLKNAADSANEARLLDFQQMDRSVAENKLKPFPFNPNQLPSEQWSKMGLKDWQIKVIKKYESSGGKFYKKEDFKRMFCITPTEYQVLEPYISIPEQKNVYADKKPEVKEVKKRLMVDLNTADSVTLLSLYGIGPSFAKRIIKYRNLLGGFYTKSQLLEVYGFDQDRLDKIADNCDANPTGIKRINLNTVRTDELKKHPYLDYYTAKAIVDQRIMLRKYTSVNQLKDIPLIHEELFNKIKYYFTTE
ncbi:MAG: helix-hairpin-helix domain-containing protein [Bacteroidales bacterium]